MTPKTTAASAARLDAPRHVGSRLKRSRRACAAISFSDALRSAGVGLRPVRPRASIMPAALPRCLVRRFFFVCAMRLWRLGVPRTRGSVRRCVVSVQRLLDGAPVAHRHVVREAVERGRGREADELAAGDLRVLVRRRRRAARAAPRGGPRRSCETCATPPRAGSSRPSARTPGRPSGAALADRGGDRARVAERGGRGQLDVERDERRRARRRAPRRGAGRSRAGRSPARARRSRRARPAPATPPRRSSRARAPAREDAVEEDRQPGAPELLPRDERLGARGAAPRASRWTTGATSSAPTCGWLPRSSRRSIRSQARARARDERRRDLALRAPRACRRCGGGRGRSARRAAARRSTRRPRRSRAIAAASRPSETLGIVRSVSRGLRHGRQQEVAAGVEHLRRADPQARLEHDDVLVDRDRDGAADPGARAERDVRRAEDLLVLERVAGQRRAVVRADAELGEVAPERAVRVEVREEGGRAVALGGGQPAVAHGQQDRRGARGPPGSDEAAIVPSPPAGERSPRRRAGCRTRRAR